MYVFVCSEVPSIQAKKGQWLLEYVLSSRAEPFPFID